MPDKETKNKSKVRKKVSAELFQQVPYNVAVIDRDFNIVEANDNFTHNFGDWVGEKCYKVYKRRKDPCYECPSAKTFEDGMSRVTDAIGIDKLGRRIHYIGHSIPVRENGKEGKVEYVMELTRAVTETAQYQQEYQILFDRVPCFITVIDQDYRIIRANEAFRERFGQVIGQFCYEVYKRRKSRCPNCPAAKTFKDWKIHRSHQEGIGKRGQDIQYVVSTSPLRRQGSQVDHVIEICTDVTKLKNLEKKIIDAERLAAVGQTVAGLAHSIKNILMGLEGGKYMISLGLQKEDTDLVRRGQEMLERNFDKTTTLVKDFLSFSKGRLPKLQMTNPNKLAMEIVDLYKDIAAKSGINLKAETAKNIKKIPLDPDAIHTCLTNLVSNAIDACQMGEQKGSEVVIKTSDEKGVLSIEVTDNGAGMDYEIKKKIFTTFFTTKGGEGTGLGLLTTRKLVQEHGGKIFVETEKGKGSCFRMEFPKNRLQAIYKEEKKNDE